MSHPVPSGRAVSMNYPILYPSWRKQTNKKLRLLRSGKNPVYFSKQRNEFEQFSLKEMETRSDFIWIPSDELSPEF